MLFSSDLVAVAVCAGLLLVCRPAVVTAVLQFALLMKPEDWNAEGLAPTIPLAKLPWQACIYWRQEALG